MDLVTTYHIHPFEPEMTSSEENSVTGAMVDSGSTEAGHLESIPLPHPGIDPEIGSSPSTKTEKEIPPIIIPATSMCKQQYQCRMCAAVFSKRWNCVSHMMAHQRVRPVLECSTCGLRCIKQSQLDIHMRIHTGEKPFSCSVCQRRFTRQGQLNSHMRSHTGDKPYLCCDCGASFVSGSNLKRHQRLHAKIKHRPVYNFPSILEDQSVGEDQQVENLVNCSPTLVEDVNNDSRLPLLPSCEAVSSKLNSNFEPSEKVSLQSGGAADSDFDITNSLASVTSLNEQIEKCQSEVRAQIIPQPECMPQPIKTQFISHPVTLSQPIKAIPAMVPSQQVIIINPCAEQELLKEKVIEVSEALPWQGDCGDVKPAVMEESLPPDQAGNNSQDGEIASTWFTGVDQPGQICLTEHTSESSNEALSSLMQVDWSFFLEDQSAEETSEPLPNEVPQLLLPSSASAISTTPFQMNDPEMAVSSTTPQLGDTFQADDMSSSVSLNAPEMGSGSAAEPLSGLLAESSNVTALLMAEMGVPTVVSVPHLPAVAVSSVGQDTGQIMEVQHTPGTGQETEVNHLKVTGQVMEAEQFQAAGQLMEVKHYSDTGQLIDVKHFQDAAQVGDVEQLPAEGSSEVVPIVIILEHPFGAQQFQNMIQGLPATEDGGPIQVTVKNSAIPLQQTVIHMSEGQGSELDPTSIHGHDYILTDSTKHKPKLTKKKMEKILACDLCPRRFARQWYLTVHRQAHLREKTFTCDVCPAKFSRVGNLNRHKLMHTGEKPYQCKQCPARFASKYRLSEHERRHEGCKPYSCEICHNEFTDYSSLRRHQNIHKGDNLQHTCDICGASFRAMKSLTFHLKVHLSDECFGVTMDQDGLTPAKVPIVPFDLTEVTLSDTATMPPSVLKFRKPSGHCVYWCSVCHKSFLFSAACRQHIFSHMGARPYKCLDCGVSFSRKACARRHTEVHRREKRHKCCECGQKFQTKPRLILHNDEHLPPDMLTVPCDECEEKFSKESMVIMHKKIFHRQQLALYKPGVGIVEKQNLGKKLQKQALDTQHKELSETGENGNELGCENSDCDEHVDHEKRGETDNLDAHRKRLVVKWKNPVRKYSKIPDEKTVDNQLRNVQEKQKMKPHDNHQNFGDSNTREGPGERFASAGKKRIGLRRIKKAVGQRHTADMKTTSLHTKKPACTQIKEELSAESGHLFSNNVTNQTTVTVKTEESDRTERSSSQNQGLDSAFHSADSSGLPRPRREAARNQREFLASLQLRRKIRR